ncbi:MULTISPECIES: Crp/Fnr family transcriptional regulator [Photobacterium]|uniref:Crp/Fnr family transcriptional regulator n=1 Tax=Photobacterium TaxID=657 RepID=UPI001EF70679|nr:Crp/Fnr family transcriptional regulator [Photobacterium sp. OFAV2-7]MCG7588433.1 Crp/Fnr family transcriptional regulator [Photobacterium sp. OFAV2-7]
MSNKERIWQAFSPYAKRIELRKKEVVIEEGSMSDTLYYVESGCLRSWFNHDGKDVSFQFFLEGQFVSSFESFMYDEVSPYTVESILPSTVYAISKQCVNEQIVQSQELKDAIFQMLCERLKHYQRLFLSRIKDTPQQRYQELTNEHPELIRLIPQHYIASYLGITSVSLSRIRCRK